MNTFLSENVKYLVQDIGQSVQTQHDNWLNALNNDLTLNWQTIESYYKECQYEDFNIHEQSEDWFKVKIKSSFPIWLESHENLCKLRDTDSFFKLCEWTRRINDIKDVYHIFKQSEGKTKQLEGILILSSILERAIGNIYLLQGKNVPFLLRDLLDTKEIKLIFGKIPVAFVQIIIGTPKALNLRNLCWHGFPAINELHPCYISTLLLICASFGKILMEKKIPLDKIPYRNQIKNLHVFTKQISKIEFPNIINFLNDIESIINHCNFIGVYYIEYWECILKYFKEGKYGKGMILFLPQFEHLMRRVYCQINNCSTRLLTAEKDTLYTTLDEIFAEYLEDNCNKNQIYSGFESGFLELYHDLFTYHRGPRIRDKFSHGEIDFCDISVELMNIVLCLALITINKFNVCKVENSELRIKLTNLSVNYESNFYTASQLKQNILKVAVALQDWPSMPYPESYANYNDFQTNYSDLTHLNELLNSYNNKLIFNNRTDKRSLSEMLNFITIPTMFRPTQETRLITLFKQIVDNIIVSNENVQNNIKIKYKLFLEHKLRSRQRQSYNNMLKSVPVLHLGLLCVLQIVVHMMSSIFQNICTFYDTKCIQLLKHILRYVENVSSLTEPIKNRWDVIICMTKDISLIILEYVENNKKEMNISLH